MKNINKYYTPANISEKLNLSTSSIRRYTLSLENAGYSYIKRDDNGHRLYTIEDVRVLQYFHKLVNEKKIPFADAVKKTIADLDYINNQVDSMAIDAINAENQTDVLEQINDKMAVMYEIIKNMNDRNKELMNEIQSLKVEVGELKTDNKRLLESHENMLLIANKAEKEDEIDAPISEDIAEQVSEFKPEEVPIDKNVGINKDGVTADHQIDKNLAEKNVKQQENRIEKMTKGDEETTKKKGFWSWLLGE